MDVITYPCLNPDACLAVIPANMIGLDMSFILVS